MDDPNLLTGLIGRAILLLHYNNVLMSHLQKVLIPTLRSIIYNLHYIIAK